MLVSSVQPDEKTTPRRTLRRAAGLFAAALLLSGAVRAEPTGEGVEQWSGNKKVTPAAPRAVVTEPSAVTPRETAILPALTPPPVPVPESRPDPIVVPVQIRPTVTVPDGVVQTGGESSVTPGVVNVDIRVRPEAMTPPAAPPAPATTVIPVTVENKFPPPPPPAPPPPAPEWYEASWVPLAILGAGCVFVPSLIGLCLLLALRKSGVLLRVEVVNSGGVPMMAYHPAYAAYGGHPPYGVDGSPATAPPTNSIAAAGVEEGTAMSFDLGPTYEEEQAANAESARQLELAVLRRVFEDNMRLREDAKTATDADFAPVEPAVLPMPDDFAGYESPSDADCPAYVTEETPCETPCEQTEEPAAEPTTYVVADEPPCEPAPAGETADCVTDEAVVA